MKELLSDLRRAASGHPGPTRAAFTVVGLFAGGSTIVGSRRAIAYLVVFAVVATIVARADRAGRLSRGVWWGFAALTLLHLAGGLLPSPDPAAPMLYETWLVDQTVKFDQAVHLYGTGLVAVGLRQLHPGWSGATVWAAALAVGIGNEVIEFLLDRTFPTHVGDLENALWDVAFNLTGATLAALVTRRVEPSTGVALAHASR